MLDTPRIRGARTGGGGGKGGQRKVPSMTKSDLIVTNIAIAVNKSALSVQKKCLFSPKEYPFSFKKCPFSLLLNAPCPSDLPVPLTTDFYDSVDQVKDSIYLSRATLASMFIYIEGDPGAYDSLYRWCS